MQVINQYCHPPFGALAAIVTAGLISLPLSAGAEPGLSEGGAMGKNAIRREKTMNTMLLVLKTDERVYIRNSFSTNLDLVVVVELARNNRQFNFRGTRLIPASADMTAAALQGGTVIHANGDDSTPWLINGMYIGGNHGCPAMQKVICPNHGKTTADIGREWRDAAGTPFYLIRIAATNELWFLSRNTGTGAVWKFNNTLSGATLTNQAQGTTLAIATSKPAQLYPACRIRSQAYLADDRPLPNDTPTSCSRLDLVEDYDIINPGSLLDDLRTHPGEERDFTAGHLDAVIANHIVYRFYPNGANVIHYTAKALQEFELSSMGFIQSACLTQGAYGMHEYYIPKTLPFTKNGARFDFRKPQDFTAPIPAQLNFTAAETNIESSANLPDRFIQFLGTLTNGKPARSVGYALGYSLIQGMSRTAERSRNTARAISIGKSRKSYPVAINSKMGPRIPANTTFECIAYRQYFNPADHARATCVYAHPEGDDWVVYADYHAAVDHDIVKLPAALAGKTITVIEKTPSLILHTDKAVPAEGVAISVTNSYGYLVFKAR